MTGLAGAAAAERLRVATWEIGLTARGPGIVLRDILRGNHDDKARAIAELGADVLLLTGIDHDADLLTLKALRDRVAAAGLDYPHLFALPPNTGVPTGFDLDRDGRLGGPRDAQGYGLYRGQGGMALLSRHPVMADGVRDFSRLLWHDLPGALLPPGWYRPAELAVLRLSHTGHWVVPVRVGDTVLTLMAFSATPPVFDGPEDRNGRRNADEIRLWRLLLDGAVGEPPAPPFAILGKANLDPVDGEGRHEAIGALLADPRLQDPEPRGGGAAFPTPRHLGDPGLDTADFADPVPGNLRVSYVLPSAGLQVLASGVAWPEDAGPAERSRHFPVWVDLEIP